MQLEGKIALITGAGHRLGKTIALALANEGCHLMIHFNQAQTPAAETATQAESIGVRAALVQADLSVTQGVRKTFSALDSAYGGIDLLVNSAAILERRKLLEVEEDDWRRSIGLNLKGAFFVLQEGACKAGARDRWSMFQTLLATARGKNSRFIRSAKQA